MNNNILVSVIMVAFNHEKFIKKAIESVLNQQTNFNYEIIIHDDASTDETANIIRKYQSKYPEKIHSILATENKYSKGIKFTSKELIPMARGKYYAFIECDDYWTDMNKLQKQVDYLEQHSEVVAAAHRHNIIDENDNVLDSSLNGIQLDRCFNHKDAFEFGEKLFHPNTVLIRTEIVKNEEYAKGTELCKLGSHSFLVYYLAMKGDIYVSSEIMSVWRKVVVVGGNSYSSREITYPITYSIMQLEKVCNYRDFFNGFYDFSDKIIDYGLSAYISLKFKKEENINKKDLKKKYRKLLNFKERIRVYFRFLKFGFKRFFKK